MSILIFLYINLYAAGTKTATKHNDKIVSAEKELYNLKVNSHTAG